MVLVGAALGVHQYLAAFGRAKVGGHVVGVDPELLHAFHGCRYYRGTAADVSSVIAVKIAGSVSAVHQVRVLIGHGARNLAAGDVVLHAAHGRRHSGLQEQ
jgi:hypothetical protein